MRSPVDELSRKNNYWCSVECSFLRNSVISQRISKVDTSTCRSRSPLSNAVLEVMLRELRPKLSPSKLFFCEVYAFSAQVAKVMGLQVHRTSGDCMLSTLVPLQALDPQLHDAVWIVFIAQFQQKLRRKECGIVSAASIETKQGRRFVLNFRSWWCISGRFGHS